MPVLPRLSSRPPDSQLSTSRPTMRAARITSVFSTPWISAMVTMSPFATWPISWPSTAATCSRSICSSRPVLTATSELFFVMPVAKAFISGAS